MGPFLLLYAALVGFFAFAAVYHLILWSSSRKEVLLAVFSADCAARAALSWALLTVATATTPEEAFGALRVRIAVGILAMVTWIWSMSLVSGVRARWFLWPTTILFLILFVIQTLVMPLNSPVLSVDQATMPWGETIASPRLEPSGWWVAPLYFIGAMMASFGLLCGYRLWAKDRVAGALIMTSASGILLVFGFELLRRYAHLSAPFVGVVPQICWVAAMAILIARNRSRTRDQLEASERRLRLTQISVDLAVDPVFWISPTSEILYVNDAACRHLGRSREEILGTKIPTYDPDYPVEAWASHWQILKQAGSLQFDTRHQTKRGIRHVEVHAKFQEIDGLEYNFAVVRDITERKLAAEKLREKEALLSRSQQIAHIGSWDFDFATHRVKWTDEMYRLYGVSPEWFVPSAEAVIGLVHPEDRDAFRKQMMARFAGENPEIVEYRVPHPDGSIRVLSAQSEMIRDAAGKPVRLIGATQDITERKRAEEELRRTADLLRGVAEGTTDAVFVKDREGKYLLFNEAACRVVDKPLAEVLGQDDTAHFEPESAQRMMERDRQVMASGLAGTEEMTLTAAGIARTWHATKAPYRDAAGNVIGVIGISRDITERKRMEENLTRSEDSLRAFMDALPETAVLLDRSGTVLVANEALAKCFGKFLGDIIGQTGFQFMPADVAEPRKAMIERVFCSGKPHHFEDTNSRRHFINYLSPVVDAGGQVSRVAIFAVDITERKRMEETLKKSEHQLRTIIEATPDCVRLTDADGTLLAMNSAGLKIFEADTPDAIIGTNFYRFVAPEYREAVQQLNERACQSARGILEFEVIGLRGTRRWLESHAVPMAGDEPGTLINLSVGRDITERKRTEETLHLQARVLESMTEGVSLADEQGVILYTNPGEDAMFGYARGELIGKRVTALNSYSADENERIVGEIIDQLKSRGRWEGKFKNRRKDGSPFSTFARITSIDMRGHKYWVCVQEDVTVREHAERSLFEYHSMLNAVAEGTSDAIFVKDLEGRYLMMNSAGARAAGLTPAEVVGKNDIELFGPETGIKFIQDDRQIMATAETRLFLDTVTGAGVTHTFHSTKSVYRDSQGKIIGLVGIARDISDLMRNEEKVRESQARLAGLVEAAMDAIISFDEERRILLFNPHFSPVVRVVILSEWFGR